MVRKFMVNSAFKSPLLLRPSYQRTVSFATVNKLGCPVRGRPMPPLILSFRSYSESTPKHPLPKTSGSTESSKSSKPKDKKGWSRSEILNITGVFTLTTAVRASYLLHAILYVLITKGLRICHPVILGKFVPSTCQT
jgi:hypothetical protein